jgi:phosphotransferase system  glucose/maltose/N-acetylglucosamine-specific IIC component
MKRGGRFKLRLAGIIGWAVPAGIMLALLLPAAARAAGEGTGPSGVSAGILLAAMAVGWVGNLLHRIKKVVKAETDQAIVDYLRTHTIVFIVGLVIAAVAVWVESATYARDWGSLMWSALLTGYGSDSLLEARETATGVPE